MRLRLASIFKDFNILYAGQMEESEKHKFLAEYNTKFLYSKPKDQNYQTSNIFGTSTQGSKVTVLEISQSDGADKWLTKQ